MLQVLMTATAFYAFPSLRHLPLWDARGFAVALLIHAAATEPLFYAAHRAFHASSRLYARYHSLHHSSRVPQPFTAGSATPLEGIVLAAAMALPLAGACAAGCGSVALAFAYVLAFDSLRAMGHCNVEVFPSSLFQAIPVLRYLIYTPTYVTLPPRYFQLISVSLSRTIVSALVSDGRKSQLQTMHPRRWSRRRRRNILMAVAFDCMQL